MFEFYSMFFKTGALSLQDLKEAAKWNCISKEDFKKITGEEYIEVIE